MLKPASCKHLRYNFKYENQLNKICIIRCGCLREIEFHDKGVIERFNNNATKRKTKGDEIDDWDRETCTIASDLTNAYGNTTLISSYL